MKTRTDFVHRAAQATRAVLASGGAALAQSNTRYADVLVDDAGENVPAPLPFALDALDPVIDAKTVERHYNFHHKPSVPAAHYTDAALAKARDAGDFAW